MNKITVRTRSFNPELFEKMRSFIPENIEVIAHTGYNEWQDAARFLHDVVEMTDGFLVVCDEDCFVIDWKAVEDIVINMKRVGYVAAGVPEGGVITHRCHSWTNLNPFFVVLDCDKIKIEKAKVSRQLIDWFGFNIDWESKKPSIVLGAYNHDKDEIFSGFFYWLYSIGDICFMNASTLGDGITTEVKGLDGRPIAYHTWYSRDNGEGNVARINNIYKIAKASVV